LRVTPARFIAAAVTRFRIAWNSGNTFPDQVLRQWLSPAALLVWRLLRLLFFFDRRLGVFLFPVAGLPERLEQRQLITGNQFPHLFVAMPAPNLKHGGLICVESHQMRRLPMYPPPGVIGVDRRCGGHTGAQLLVGIPDHPVWGKYS
jgi:hypothetical protein